MEIVSFQTNVYFWHIWYISPLLVLKPSWAMGSALGPALPFLWHRPRGQLWPEGCSLFTDSDIDYAIESKCKPNEMDMLKKPCTLLIIIVYIYWIFTVCQILCKHFLYINYHNIQINGMEYVLLSYLFYRWKKEI